MVQSLQTSNVVKMAGLSLLLMLAGCFNGAGYKRQASGDEDYLKSPTLHPLNSPPGMTLPAQNDDYQIPSVPTTGLVGKALDIRPPVQALALLSGSRVESSGDTAQLYLPGSESSALWKQIVKIIDSNGYKTTEREDAKQTLTTDWIIWKRADEDKPIAARYQISLQQEGYQNRLSSKLLALKQGDQPSTAPPDVQRYSLQMLNTLSEQLEKIRNVAQATDNQNSGHLDVQSGSDDTGLPVLIVRTSYNVLWERLPAGLKTLGMEIKDRNRSQGWMNIKYKAPGAKVWQQLGVTDPKLPEGEYKLQLGDLENRSSLQFIHAKGQVLIPSQNDALVTVVEAALNQTKK